MEDFFDSSVFVAAVSEDDIEHKSAIRVWSGSSRRVMYAHGLLECFSILTGGRHPASLPPAEAATLISENMKAGDVAMIQFSGEETLELMRNAHQRGVRGGAVYDFMHICAARKAGASRIFTLNKRHFTAIAPELAPQIFHPLDV